MTIELKYISPSESRLVIKMLLEKNPDMNDAQIDEYLAESGYTLTQNKVAVVTPTIKEVSDKLLTEKRDYGMFWLVSKLVAKDVQGSSEGSTHSYGTWVSNKDADFIFPKLMSWDRKQLRIRKNLLTVQGVGFFTFCYAKGNNGNCQISLNFTQFK